MVGEARAASDGRDFEPYDRYAGRVVGSDDDRRSGEPRREVREIGLPFDPAPSVAAAAQVLAELGVPFALIGGVALDAWEITRATKDVDFAVPVGAAEAAAARVGGETRPLRIGGAAVRDAERGLHIDFIDRRFHFAALFGDAIAEAGASGRVAQVRGAEVPLVSLEHLLAMKMVSGEPKDDADVARILARPSLDLVRARELVERHLGAATANRLDIMARTAGRADAPPRYDGE